MVDNLGSFRHTRAHPIAKICVAVVRDFWRIPTDTAKAPQRIRLVGPMEQEALSCSCRKDMVTGRCFEFPRHLCRAGLRSLQVDKKILDLSKP